MPFSRFPHTGNPGCMQVPAAKNGRHPRDGLQPGTPCPGDIDKWRWRVLSARFRLTALPQLRRGPMCNRPTRWCRPRWVSPGVSAALVEPGRAPYGRRHHAPGRDTRGYSQCTATPGRASGIARQPVSRPPRHPSSRRGRIEPCNSPPFSDSPRSSSCTTRRPPRNCLAPGRSPRGDRKLRPPDSGRQPPPWRPLRPWQDRPV